MRLTLHNHTVAHSDCASIPPEELIYYTALIGLQGLAITEHNYVWTPEEIARLRELCIARNYCTEEFLIMAGQEFGIPGEGVQEIHSLIFGNCPTIPDKITLEELCSHVHTAGGIIVIAHPLRVNNLIPDFWKYDVDGVEALYPCMPKDEMQALMAQQGQQFAQLGSSDVHHQQDMLSYATYFPDWVKTEADVLRAIREKKTRAIGAYDKT